MSGVSKDAVVVVSTEEKNVAEMASAEVDLQKREKAKSGSSSEEVVGNLNLDREKRRSREKTKSSSDNSSRESSSSSSSSSSSCNSGSSSSSGEDTDIVPVASTLKRKRKLSSSSSSEGEADIEIHAPSMDGNSFILHEAEEDNSVHRQGKKKNKSKKTDNSAGGREKRGSRSLSRSRAGRVDRSEKAGSNKNGVGDGGDAVAGRSRGKLSEKVMEQDATRRGQKHGKSASGGQGGSPNAPVKDAFAALSPGQGGTVSSTGLPDWKIPKIDYKQKYEATREKLAEFQRCFVSVESAQHCIDGRRQQIEKNAHIQEKVTEKKAVIRTLKDDKKLLQRELDEAKLTLTAMKEEKGKMDVEIERLGEIEDNWIHLSRLLGINIFRCPFRKCPHSSVRNEELRQHLREAHAVQYPGQVLMAQQTVRQQQPPQFLEAGARPPQQQPRYQQQRQTQWQR